MKAPKNNKCGKGMKKLGPSYFFYCNVKCLYQWGKQFAISQIEIIILSPWSHLGIYTKELKTDKQICSCRGHASSLKHYSQ